MKKKMKIILGVVLFIVILLVVKNHIMEEDDFNFSLTYNVDGKDFISTYENLLIKDTISGIKTIEFEFNKEDLRKIRSKVLELGIMEEDFRGMPKSGFQLSTIAKYKLKIDLNGESKIIYWTTENSSLKIPLEQNDKDRYEGEYGRVNKLLT